MESYKLTKIRNLKDEVKEFHPLLRTLFPRLPNITEIEYTQGNTEMGADFILTKYNETLDDVEYIGCIVKVGQIKQDHAEVNRQIEECEIEKIIQGGKRKIFLNEIWIISNGNITNGAQHKIHHKYNNKNIKFIPDEKLTNLIERYYPEYWTDLNVHTGEYLRNLKELADKLCNSNSLISITNKEAYVPQQLIHIKTRRDIFDESNKVKRVSLSGALEKENFILVEAPMGTGKSKLLAEIAKHYASNEIFQNKRILPILINTTELIGKFSSDISLLIESIVKIENFAELEGLIILIDGLDELKVSSEERLEIIKKVFNTSQQYDNLKVVISTRPIDEPKVEAEIEKLFSRYRLCSLTVKQVIFLVDKICSNVEIKNKLLKDLDKSHLFKVLPKTPISAILLAKLLNENIQEIPSTMTDLYSKYMELSLGRWDMAKGLQSQQEYDIIHNVTIDVAKFIINNSLYEISDGDVKQIFDDYFDNRNLKNINKEEVLKKLVNKSEIFNHNKNKKTLSFRHRTFAEFFYAEGLMRDSNAHISEEIYDLYWSTSYFFYIGLRRDCPEILQAIRQIHFTDQAYKILKIFNNGNFLLAAYLTPYSIIKDLVFDSFKHAAEFYIEVLTGEQANPLKKLPPMQLLCIITQALCETFGYDYFAEIVKEYAYEISTLSNLSDEQYVELFLINSVRMVLNDSEAYDTMIENYGKHIPLQIQAGISEHSNANNSHSAIVKRYVKRFKKSTKNNISLRKSLIDLYNEPAEKFMKPNTL